MCRDLADLLNENAVIRSVRVAAFFSARARSGAPKLTEVFRNPLSGV